MSFELVKEHVLAKLNNLSSNLVYHSKQHTLDVLNSLEELIIHENVDEHSAHLLRVAAIFHDTGFLEVYINHEEKGCEYAKEWLPSFGYKDDDIARICDMVMATKIPHAPKDRFCEIICDADLDYIGTKNYEEISKRLYKEWVHFDMVHSEEEWLDKQIGFLKMHTYFTPHFVKNRVPTKLALLQRLEAEKAARS